MTSVEVENLKKDLKISYKIEYEEIKTSPLNVQSVRKLEEIYVRLALLGEMTHEKHVTISYDELFEIR